MYHLIIGLNFEFDIGLLEDTPSRHPSVFEFKDTIVIPLLSSVEHENPLNRTRAVVNKQFECRFDVDYKTLLYPLSIALRETQPKVAQTYWKQLQSIAKQINAIIESGYVPTWGETIVEDNIRCLVGFRLMARGVEHKTYTSTSGFIDLHRVVVENRRLRTHERLLLTNLNEEDVIAVVLNDDVQIELFADMVRTMMPFNQIQVLLLEGSDTNQRLTEHVLVLPDTDMPSTLILRLFKQGDETSLNQWKGTNPTLDYTATELMGFQCITSTKVSPRTIAFVEVLLNDIDGVSQGSMSSQFENTYRRQTAGYIYPIRYSRPSSRTFIDGQGFGWPHGSFKRF